MSISFESALGIHDQALLVRSRRAEHIASNIANADTPGYKAKDIDFKSALAEVQTMRDNNLNVTHAGHMPLSADMGGIQTLYRVPQQVTLDGNTVDSQVEKSAFADNALRYQASLTFLDGRFKGLITAIKGE